MIFDDLSEKYPILSKTSNYLEEKCYFFKGVLKQLRDLGPDYGWGEELCKRAFEMSGGDWKCYFEKVQTLIDFSLEFLNLQIKLEKTGGYPYSSFLEVEKNVYNDPNRKLKGPWYIWALYFSQFFWVTHNKVFSFFVDDFIKNSPDTGFLLEVPTGTGLFITKFLLNRSAWGGVGVDLGETSIKFTKDVMDVYGLPPQRVKIINEDIYKFKTDKKFDRILCGEFLEHVEDPFSVLVKLKNLLNDNGKIFLTVAVWAAMIDHIYLYSSPEDVRLHIKKAGLKIEKELVQSVFRNRKPEDGRVPVNYCAILSKNGEF